MQAHYLVSIKRPENHQVNVSLTLKNISTKKNYLDLFLPSWSPGSYLMREYARLLTRLKVTTNTGKVLEFKKIEKSIWRVNHEGSTEIHINYNSYCHDLTVRTSFIDQSHAFLHGPSYLMGVKDTVFNDIKLKLDFPHDWKKVITGLEDDAQNREDFSYSAKSYDELIDCPIEIGNHDSDGFLVQGKEHHLAFYGKTWAHGNDLKTDIKKAVEYVSEYMGEIPYEKYCFITHFAPGYFGGLEHLNSTALGFDGQKLGDRKSYVRWLTLVVHEYFHTWNVKRIRPLELGPFNYTEENYTSMHWLTEGLTSFMDNYLTYKSDLCSQKEYWSLIKDDLNRYIQTPGAKLDSLEESSFDAWIKLYRPHENSSNMTVSYYLKGGLVFLGLYGLFQKEGKDFKALIRSLWDDYKKRPELGITKLEFFKILEKLVSKETLDWFDDAISTTKDLGLEEILNQNKISIIWEDPKYELGVNYKFEGDRVFIKSIVQDGSAFKSGLNAGDEILAIDGIRVLKNEAQKITSLLDTTIEHNFCVNRSGSIINIRVLFIKGSKKIKEIVSENKNW